MQCKLIREPSAFWALEADWDSLLHRSQCDNFFLNWVWVSNWWRAFGAVYELWLIVAYEGGNLVGIAPLCRHSRRLRQLLPYHELSLMGSGVASADHLDFLAVADQSAEIVGEMLRFLWEETAGWDLLTLAGLAEDSVVMDWVAERMPASQTEIWHEPAPYISLPATWEAYQATLGKNLRQNWRRLTRRLTEQNQGTSPYQLVTKREEVVETMQKLFSLHQRVRQEKGDAGAFASEPVRHFHQNLAEACRQLGWLRLYRLQLGRTIAVIYGIRYGETLLYYATGYDLEASKMSPGRQLFGFMVQQAIAEGMLELDLLRGDESYKFDWTTQVRQDVTVRMPASRRGRLLQWGRKKRVST